MRGSRRRKELEIRHAEDENLARGAKFDPKLLLVANVEGELVLDVGILPLASGPKASIKISADQRADGAAGIRGELLRGVANDAGVHLVFEEAAAKAVFAGEDRTGLDVSAQLAVVDLPGREARNVPKLLLVDVVCQTRLDLVLPEAQAGIERRVGVEVSAGSVEAVVDGVIRLSLLPAQVNRLEEDVGDSSGLSRSVEEVGVESSVEHRDHEGPSVLSAKDLLLRSHAIRSDDAANVDIRFENGIAIWALDRVNRLRHAEGSSVETRRRRGAVFEAGKTSDIVPQLLRVCREVKWDYPSENGEQEQNFRR